MRVAQWLIVYLILAPVAIALWILERVFKIKWERFNENEKDKA